MQTASAESTGQLRADGRVRLNTPMIKRGLRRLLAGRWVSLPSVAKEARVLHPVERQRCAPAVYLPGALDKISAISPYRSRSRGWQLIQGGVLDQGASLAYRLENVEIFSPGVYCGPAMDHVAYGDERLLVRDVAAKSRLDQANLVVTWNGAHFFGPYLMSELLLELLGEDPARNISMSTKPYEHEPGYRALLGLKRPPLVTHAWVKELTIFSEPLQNGSKARRWRILRERLRAVVPGAANPYVYLKRGATGERRVIDNEEDIERLLCDAGFDVVEPARLTAEEIVRRTLDARLVVSMEGSHLAHLVYTLGDGGTLLVFQPPDRFALPYKEFTDCLGMRFAFLVGDKTAQGFRIAPDELARMLELLA